jgi:uncharacterized protein with PhoU and TrkA domain
MVLVGRHLLPKTDITKDLNAGHPGVSEYYDFQQRLAFVQLPDPSRLHGKSLQQSRLGAALGLNVVTILRGQEPIYAPSPDFVLHSGDRLLVEGQLDQLAQLDQNDHHLLTQEPLPLKKIHSADVQLAEAEIPPGASSAGMTLRQSAFRHVYKAMVLAIRRDGKTFYTDLGDVVLQDGDKLLVKGREADLLHLEENKEFILSYRESYSDYKLDDLLMMVRVPSDSSLAGSSLVDSRLGDAFGLSVQGIIRDKNTELMPDPNEILQMGDILIIKGTQDSLNTIKGLQNLVVEKQLQPG